MADIRLTRSIIVNADINDIFHYFNDPDEQMNWMVEPPLRQEATDGYQLGSQWTSVTSFMGREIETSSEVTEYDAPYLMGYRAEGAMTGDVQHRFAEVDGGIEVTIDALFTAGGVLGAIGAPLIKSQGGKRMEADLASFKTYMEG